ALVCPPLLCCGDLILGDRENKCYLFAQKYPLRRLLPNGYYRANIKTDTEFSASVFLTPFIRINLSLIDLTMAFAYAINDPLNLFFFPY
ncbi:hypothetical protein, partial [Peptoniphilus sp. EMRHCC_23]|uniref:hypothetical protein n=1 Tax=Peptoniphilus rachelemmaiella TaxID=2811779 RepID=UPI001C0085F3